MHNIDLSFSIIWDYQTRCIANSRFILNVLDQEKNNTSNLYIRFHDFNESKNLSEFVIFKVYDLDNKEYLRLKAQNSQTQKIFLNIQNSHKNTTIHSLQVQPLEWVHIEFDWFEEIITIQSIKIHVQFNNQSFGYQFRNEIDQVHLQNQICLLKTDTQNFFELQKQIKLNPHSSLINFQYAQLDIKGFKFQLWIFNNEPQKNLLSLYGSDHNLLFQVQNEGLLQFILNNQNQSIILDTYDERLWLNIFYCSLYQDEFHQNIFIKITYRERVFVYEKILKIYLSFNQYLTFNHGKYKEFIIEQSSINQNQLYSIQWDQISDDNSNKDQLLNMQNEFSTKVRSEFTCQFSYVLVDTNCVRCPQLENLICLSCLFLSKEWINKFECNYQIQNNFFAYNYQINYFLNLNNIFQIDKTKIYKKSQLNSKKQLELKQINVRFWYMESNTILGIISNDFLIKQKNIVFTPCNEYQQKKYKNNLIKLKNETQNCFLMKPIYYISYVLQITMYQLFEQIVFGYQNMNYQSIQDIINELNYHELLFVEKFTIIIINEDINQISTRQLGDIFNFKFWSQRIEIAIIFQANNLKVFTFEDKIIFKQNIQSLEIIDLSLSITIVKVLLVEVKCQQLKLVNVIIQGQVSFNIYSLIFVVNNFSYISIQKQTYDVFNFILINELRYASFNNLYIDFINLELVSIINLSDQGNYYFEQINIFNCNFLASHFLILSNKQSQLSIQDIWFEQIHLDQFSFVFCSESNYFRLLNVTVAQSGFQRSFFVEFRNIYAKYITFTNVSCFQNSIIFLNFEKNSKVHIEALKLNQGVISNSKLISLEYVQYSEISIEDIFIDDIQYYQHDQSCLFEVRAEDIYFSNMFFNQSTLLGCVFSFQSIYITLKQIYLIQINKEIQNKTFLLVPFIIIDKLRVLYMEDFYISDMSVNFIRLFQINEDILESKVSIVDFSILNIIIQVGQETSNQIQSLFYIKQAQFSELEFYNIKLTFTQENINLSPQEQQGFIFNINSQGYINFYQTMINIDTCTQQLGGIFNIQSLEFEIIDLKFSVLNCQSLKSYLYNIQAYYIHITSNVIVNFIKSTQFIALFKQFTKLLIQDFKLMQMVPQISQQLFVLQVANKQNNINIQFSNINIIRHYVMRSLISIEGIQIQMIRLINIQFNQCSSAEKALVSIQLQKATSLLLFNINIINNQQINTTKCSFINLLNVQQVLIRNLTIQNSKCSKIQLEGSKMVEFSGISIINSFFSRQLIKVIGQNQSILIWKQVLLINNSKLVDQDIIIAIQVDKMFFQKVVTLNMRSPTSFPFMNFDASSIQLEQFIFCNNECQNTCIQISLYSEVKFIEALIVNNFANFITRSSFSKLQINHTTFNNRFINDSSISIKLEKQSTLKIYDSNIINNKGNIYTSDKISSNFSFFYQFEGQQHISNNNQNLSLIINNYNLKLNSNIKYIYLPSGIYLGQYKRFHLESLSYSQYIFEFILLSKYAQSFIIKSESIALEVETNQSVEVGINQKSLMFIMDPYINQVGVIFIQGIENQTEKFQFSIKTFPCQIGEISKERKCLQCIGPTLYSVAKKSQKCKIIDQEKIIESNFGLLNLKPEFWRPSLRNDYIEDCPSCVGGWNVGDKLCKQPYIGATCSECDLYNVQGGGNFSKDQNSNCIQCGSNYKFWIYLFLLMVWQLITLMISVKSHVKVSSNYQILKLQTKFYEILNKLQVDQLQVLTKQMQLYFQVLTYMYQNNISNIILIVSNPIQIINQQTLCYGLYFQTNYSYLYILILFFNLLINLSFYFVLFTIAIQLKVVKYKASYIFTPIFILFNFKEIILFDYISKLLTSVKISNISWVQANLSLWYYDNQHQQHLIWISISFGTLILLFILIYLYLFKNKSFLLNCHFYSVYGSIYKEYNRSKYYWEFIRLIFKIILVFLTRISLIYNRISTLIILTLTYLGLINSQQPFLLQNLNSQEEAIFKMFILTFTLTILLITNQNVIFLIYVINILYVASILRLMIKIYSQNNIEQIDYIKKKIVQCIPYLQKLKCFKSRHPLQIHARQQFRRIKINFKVINNRQRPKLSLNIEPIAYPSENSSFSQVQRLETQSKQIEMQQFDL
ncbi:hypothetical protein pb186bvf_007673 [Paramecium bursaria]